MNSRLLTFAFVGLILCLLGGDQPAPRRQVLLANEDFYKSQEGKEQVFEGTLKYTKPLAATTGRENPFRLVMKDETRPVYIGGKDNLLLPFADKVVRIVGKPVEVTVINRTHREIWPASIEAVPVKK